MKGKKSKKGNRFTKRQRDIESVDMREAKNESKPADYRDRKQEDAKAGGCNDWRWYARSPEMVKAAASFQYSYAIGNPGQFNVPDLDNTAVPGIMSIGYAPAIGYAQNEVSPVNIAMRQIYSDVRHKNSGAATYDPPDLMMYLLAMDSVYMYISFLRRIYGVVFGYQTQNRYIPKALLLAMGVDYDDIQQNLPNLLWYINLLSAKTAGSLCIPNGMAYMARHTWMTSGLYLDSATSKAQIYMYVPTSYLKLVNPASQEEAVTTLIYTTKPGTSSSPATFNDLVAFGNSLVDVLIANEDINIMSGDILKAYGLGGVVSLPAVSDNYTVTPEYNAEVLSQMENSTIIGSTMSGTITQATDVGTGYIIANYETQVTYQPVLTGTLGTVAQSDRSKLSSVWQSNAMLNFHHMDPTPELVLVATRGTFRAKVATTTQNANVLATQVDYRSVGSEIYTHARMYVYQYNSSGVASLADIPIQSVMVCNMSDSTAMSMIMLTMSILSQFDWHPNVVLIPGLSVNGNLSLATARYFMDTDVNAYISPYNLEIMAETALLSEFWAPTANSTNQ